MENNFLSLCEKTGYYLVETTPQNKQRKMIVKCRSFEETKTQHLIDRVCVNRLALKIIGRIVNTGCMVVEVNL